MTGRRKYLWRHIEHGILNLLLAVPMAGFLTIVFRGHLWWQWVVLLVVSLVVVGWMRRLKPEPEEDAIEAIDMSQCSAEEWQRRLHAAEFARLHRQLKEKDKEIAALHRWMFGLFSAAFIFMLLWMTSGHG